MQLVKLSKLNNAIRIAGGGGGGGGVNFSRLNILIYNSKYDVI